MKINNIHIIPERWKKSDKQIQEILLAFEFETIIRQIKNLYFGAIKRLEKRSL